MKKVFALIMAMAMTVVLFCGMSAQAEDIGIHTEAVREGDTIRLNVITEEAANISGIGVRLTAYNDEVFEFSKVVPLNGLTTVQPGTVNDYMYVDTDGNITVPAGSAIFYIEFNIIGTIAEGTEYVFSIYVEEAFDYDWNNYDAWIEQTLTTAYTEAPLPTAPAVSFEKFDVRERGEEDSTDALRVGFKVVFNDSYLTYANGTVYGSEGEGNYEITALSIRLTRTDIEGGASMDIPCSKIWTLNAAEGSFLFNVTLTGIKEGHYAWQFKAEPTVTYALNGAEETATCDAEIFTINDALNID